MSLCRNGRARHDLIYVNGTIEDYLSEFDVAVACYWCNCYEKWVFGGDSLIEERVRFTSHHVG